MFFYANLIALDNFSLNCAENIQKSYYRLIKKLLIYIYINIYTQFFFSRVDFHIVFKCEHPHPNMQTDDQNSLYIYLLQTLKIFQTAS